MDRDRDQPTGNKLVDLASRFTLSSRWFAFALVVAVIATVRQVNDMRGSSGPQLILNVFGLLVTLLLVAISGLVIAVRYWHPSTRPPDRR